MKCSVHVAIIGGGQAEWLPAGLWMGEAAGVRRHGLSVQADGRTNVPGLYFMGVHWLRKAKSSILYGAGENAEIVARHIVEART
jgi:putative flavoprotein involved in K+ transport